MTMSVMTVFHNTIPDLQDQDQDTVCKTKNKTKTDFVWSQTGLVLRPTVSDHITDQHQ